MTPSRRGIFARNISSNMAGYLVNAAVMLFLTPFVLEHLGKEAWGLWAVLIATTGSYGVFDLGVRSALGQYLTRYHAQERPDKVNESLSTALMLVLGLALLGILVTLLLGAFLPEFLATRNPELDPAALEAHGHAARHTTYIIGISTALCLPMALFQTVTYAKERMDLSNGLGIAERLLIALGSVWVLESGWGMVGLAWVVGGLQLGTAAARVLLAFRLMPGLRAHPRLFRRAAVRELVSYGVYNSAVNAADRVVLATDALVILWALNEAAVAAYSAGDKLIPVYTQLVLAVTWAVTPHATACDARGDRPALLQLLRNGTRGSAFLAAVIAGGLLLVGEPFLALWLDPEFTSGEEFVSSGYILQLLAVAALLRGAASCGRQILFATRRMKLMAGMSGLEMLCNLGLSVVLVQSWGIEGVAWGTLVPILLIYGLWQGLAIQKRLGLPFRLLLADQARAILPTLLAMYGTDLLLREWLPVLSWGELILRSCLLLVPALLVGYFLVLTASERDKLHGSRSPSH